MKVELTNGNWAELREPETLRNRDRKALMLSVDNVKGDIAKGIAMSESLLKTLVTEWSLEMPIPSVDSNSIDELLPGDATLLLDSTEKARNALFPSFDTNPLDPKAQEAS